MWLIRLIRWKVSNLLDNLYFRLNRRMLAQQANLRERLDEAHDSGFVTGYRLGKQQTELPSVLKEANDIVERKNLE